MLAYHKGDGNDVTKKDLTSVDEHLNFASKRLNVLMRMLILDPYF